MADSTWDSEEPTAVRHMKELLGEYEQNASAKLAALRESIRRNTPRPASDPGAEKVAREPIPTTKPAPFADAPTKKHPKPARRRGA